MKGKEGLCGVFGDGVGWGGGRKEKGGGDEPEGEACCCSSSIATAAALLTFLVSGTTTSGTPSALIPPSASDMPEVVFPVFAASIILFSKRLHFRSQLKVYTRTCNLLAICCCTIYCSMAN